MRRSAAALVLVFSLLLGLVATTEAGKRGRDRTTVYTIPGDAVFPEGIGYDGRKNFYVSSTGDGTIFKGRAGKPGALQPFLPGGQDGRTTAIGVKATRERIYIAGGATGNIWIYDVRTRALVQRYETGTGGFLNDLTVTRGGDVYVTDSQRPILFRIDGETGQLEQFLALGPNEGYAGAGFKWNGIVSTPNGRTLIAVHSRDGDLYRIDVASKTVSKIDKGGADLTNGDGLVLNGSTLYVVRNQQERIVEMRLSRSLTRARQRRSFTSSAFMFPTTAALAKGRLLVVNSQFDRRNAGQPPELPFTVASVKRP
jgi:Cu-Zn family superoxide dismutase